MKRAFILRFAERNAVSDQYAQGTTGTETRVKGECQDRDAPASQANLVLGATGTLTEQKSDRQNRDAPATRANLVLAATGTLTEAKPEAADANAHGTAFRALEARKRIQIDKEYLARSPSNVQLGTQTMTKVKTESPDLDKSPKLLTSRNAVVGLKGRSGR